MTKINIYFRYLVTISICFMTFTGFSQKAENPVKWLSFDEITINEPLHYRTVEDKVTGQVDTIRGTYTVLKDGVHGKSLLLDGYSAYVSCRNTPSASLWPIVP